MAPKSCRHASQALRLPDFRRGLRHHDALGCEVCTAPAVRGNSRSKAGASAKRGRRSPSSPPTPEDLGDSGVHEPENDAALTLKGWAPNPAWEDVYVCITCGHMACLGKNHLMLHFQVHPKHFVGFHVASRTFWCCPCKSEIDSSKSKIQDLMKECNDVFEDIVGKQQRRVKNKLGSNPSLSPDDDDNLDSQRSYVFDDETTRGMDIDELNRMIETATMDPAEETVDGQAALMERPRSITFGTDQSRALEKEHRREKGRQSDDRDVKAQLSRDKRPQELPPLPLPIPPPPPPKTATAPSVLGFSNLGNTCYFNAATQALLTAMHFFPGFIYEDEIITRIEDSPVAATLMMLHGTIIKKTRNLPPLSPDRNSIKKGKSSGKKPVTPVLTVGPLLKEVRKKFGQFRGSYQQDAHELFTSMLWAIDEEIDPPKLMNKDQPNGSGQSQQTDLVNLFVKTDSGETISLRVSPDATKEEIRALLAKKLALDDDDLFLQPSGSRQTVSRRSLSSKQTTPTYSKVNFVRTLFGGALVTEVRCRSCGNCSETVEDAFQLSLPIPNAGNGKYVSVKDCLQQFTLETQLLVESENGYDCEKCSRPPKLGKSPSPSPSPPPSPVLRDATMRLRISELPRVLVLHLKRLGRTKKITQHIQFDAMLDMAPHVDGDVLERHESTLYELIAIVVHKGNKRAGHYVSYVSRKKVDVNDDSNEEEAFTKTTRSTMLTLDDPDHDWFYISDSLLQTVSFDQVLKCEAYMLFYQRVAPSPSPLVSPRETELRETELRETEMRETELRESELRESEIRITEDMRASVESEGDWI